MSKYRTDIISTLIRELPCKVYAIYGFGSFYSGQSTPQSDLDIAILPEYPLQSEERWRIQEKLASLIGANVDLVDLNSCSLVMQFQIIANGKKIFSSDDYKTNAFETRIYSAYCRFNEERKVVVDSILKQGSVYGR